MVSPVVVNEHDDFPVAFEDFAKVLVGSNDEIWTRLMRAKFGSLKMTFSLWRETLATVKRG